MNFVGIVFGREIFPAEAVPEVDASNATHLHIDINVQEAIQGSDQIVLELTDFVDTNNSGDNIVGTYTITSGQLQNGSWVGLNIPLADFNGLTERSKLGLLLFNSGGSISDVLIDNIYFYTQ